MESRIVNIAVLIVTVCTAVENMDIDLALRKWQIQVDTPMRNFYNQFALNVGN
jgi:hypothetical protein